MDYPNFHELLSANLDDNYFGDCEVHEIHALRIVDGKLYVDFELCDPFGTPLGATGTVVFENGVFMFHKTPA
jgi:hypothetical protein